ncbi:MAG: efflux RND transporter permease subunit [Treponema sp.]|jgi:hypothetical protein|nr:efflux RND transporter permease subunit [Treponema sp.]
MAKNGDIRIGPGSLDKGRNSPPFMGYTGVLAVSLGEPQDQALGNDRQNRHQNYPDNQQIKLPGKASMMIQPIGLTVIGGLTSSTLITLFFIPVMHSLFNYSHL